MGNLLEVDIKVVVERRHVGVGRVVSEVDSSHIVELVARSLLPVCQSFNRQTVSTISEFSLERGKKGNDSPLDLRSGQPVDEEVVSVVLPDKLVHEPRVLLRDLTQTKRLTRRVLEHVDRERRREDSVAKENRTEAFGLLCGSFVGRAKVELLVVVVV